MWFSGVGKLEQFQIFTSLVYEFEIDRDDGFPDGDVNDWDCKMIDGASLMF